jgi:protein-S-isoprenylcysteine O-methyltransferase Ste14
VRRLQTDVIGLIALGLVALVWLGFALIFLLRKKAPQAQEVKRAPAATWGIFLQSLSFAFVWLFGRPLWWPFPPSRVGELVLAAAAVLLAYGSCWFCLQSVRTLGKQWTYQARVIQGHELVTQGPYAVVRNPIYLGMLGMLVATGLVFSRWWTLLVALIIFLIGNQIRISAEEKLLREAFGAQFDDYAGRVPAFFPRFLKHN